MGSFDYLALLRREMETFATYLDRDLSVPVEHCGDWTLHRLADHLGRGNLWAATGITEKRGDYSAPPAPKEAAELRIWFDQTCGVLLTALEVDPDTEAWTFWPPHTVGFWRRRRYLEALVHRWDAEHALGIESAIDPALAADGVAEVFEVMAPRQIKRGRAGEPRVALRLTATDTGDSWSYGPGEPVTTIRATAPRLLLMLWGRLSPDDPAIEWDGDRAAAQPVLDGPLTP